MQHGYVIQIGRWSTNPIYFTGSGHSVNLNDAKVFRTARGAMIASSHWQKEDYGLPLANAWFITRKAVAVSLVLTQGELL